WTKPFPVSIGRPALRIWTHGVELLVLIPLVAALGAAWGATGAATAVLVSSIAFCAYWTVLFVRIKAGPPLGAGASGGGWAGPGAGPPARGGPPGSPRARPAAP